MAAVTADKNSIVHICASPHKYYSYESDYLGRMIEPYDVFPSNRLRPYLALAQHYAGGSNGSYEFRSLKTSLLDVTYGLDIAAYFAVSTDNKNNGKIFIFDPEKIKKPYVFYEPHI